MFTKGQSSLKCLLLLQARLAVKLEPGPTRGLVAAQLCVGLGSATQFKIVALQAQLVVPLFRVLCNGKEQPSGASISLQSMQPGQQISMPLQINNTGTVPFNYQILLAAGAKGIACTPCKGRIAVAACATLALNISAPAALTAGSEFHQQHHDLSLHIGGPFPLAFTGICGFPKLRSSQMPTVELRTADASKLRKQQQEGVKGIFKIVNNGFASATIQTANPSFCLEPQELHVPEKQEQSAKLRWWPGRFGVHCSRHRVRLSSSDLSAPSFQCDMQMSVKGPSLHLSPPLLQFNATMPGQEGILPFTISNQGTKVLNGQLSLARSTAQPAMDSLVLMKPGQSADEPHQVLPILGHTVCLQPGEAISLAAMIRANPPAAFQHAQLQLRASNQLEIGPDGSPRNVVSSIQILVRHSADNRLPQLATVYEQPQLKWMDCCWTDASSAMLNHALFDMNSQMEGLMLGQTCFAILGANREPSSPTHMCLALQHVQQALSASTLQAFFSHALHQACGMTMSGQGALLQLAECIAAQPDVLHHQAGAIPLCMAGVLGRNAQKFVAAVLPLLNEPSAMPAAAAMLAKAYQLRREQTAAMQDFTATICEMPADVSCTVAFANIFGSTRFMTLSRPLLDLASDLAADAESARSGKASTLR